MKPQKLIALADETRESAYSPYSGFCVGAALLCRDGSVYTGCNIENASFTPTCCAERVAIFKAVSEGKRDFRAIAVVGGERGKEPRELCYPCGVCRQVMAEFASPDLDVYFFDGSHTTLGELLPKSFSLKK